MTPAFYRPTLGAPRPCTLAMIVPDDNSAIIYPGGWTQPKTIPITQLLMPDDVEDLGNEKSGHDYRVKTA